MSDLFSKNENSIEVRLDNFPKYVRRVPLKRFLALYEIFRQVLPVKGSVIECGVFRGFGLMSWAKLSAILEPENLTRRIYGFDTFAGFPAVGERDSSRNPDSDNRVGDLAADSYGELVDLISAFDKDRYLGHIPKVELVRGDMLETIPEFLRTHPHLLISLLFIDCDMYEPTLAALRSFVPRMPKGAVVAFDELDNPKWPGETQAMLEFAAGRPLRLRRLEWDPYIAYTEIE
jgi:hypothetical protein